MDALFDAISHGDADAVERMLDRDSALLEAERGGTTALLFALYTGHHEIVRLFRERGRKLRFWEACAFGEAKTVAQFLDADPALASQRSADGFAPVALAIFFRHPGVARLLVERGADVCMQATNPQRVAPLHAAAAVGDFQSMEMLLERGADVNARQQDDFTPLHGAAGRGDRAMAELLLAHGADRGALTAGGLNAGDVARKHGQVRFAEWFAARLAE